MRGWGHVRDVLRRGGENAALKDEIAAKDRVFTDVAAEHDGAFEKHSKLEAWVVKYRSMSVAQQRRG